MEEEDDYRPSTGEYVPLSVPFVSRHNWVKCLPKSFQVFCHWILPHFPLFLGMYVCVHGWVSAKSIHERLSLYMHDLTSENSGREHGNERMVSPKPTRHSAVFRQLARYKAMINQSGSHQCSRTQAKAGSRGKQRTSSNVQTLPSVSYGLTCFAQRDSTTTQCSDVGQKCSQTKKSKCGKPASKVQRREAKNGQILLWITKLQCPDLTQQAIHYQPVGKANDIPACQAAPKRQALIVAL